MYIHICTHIHPVHSSDHTEYLTQTVSFLRSGTASFLQLSSVVKNLPANARGIRDAGSIPGWGRCPAEGNGSPLQYSCPENPMDRGAWRATVHRVAQSWTQLKWLSTAHLNNELFKCLIWVLGTPNCYFFFFFFRLWLFFSWQPDNRFFRK